MIQKISVHRNTLPIGYNHYVGTCLAIQAAKEAKSSLSMSAQDIIMFVCVQFKISRTDIASHIRKRTLVTPRQLCYFLMKRKTPLSLKEMAAELGTGHDHATVISSIRAIQNILDTNGDYSDRIREVCSELGVDIKSPNC